MKSFGYLRYDPKHRATKFKPWWLLLQCNDELTAYYRNWIEKEHPYEIRSKDWLEKACLTPNVNKSWPITQHGVKVTRSAWGSHISVVRGEKIPYKNLWKKYNGKKIWFEYNPEYLNTNGKHWWIRAVSPQLEEIRQEMGLTPQPTYFDRRTKKIKVNPFHLTIGHMLH
jgi:hypothetical protein